MKTLLYSAMSATIGVMAFFSWNWSIAISSIIFLFYLLWKTNLRNVMLQLVVIAIFLCTSYISDTLHKTGLTGRETSFHTTIYDLPSFDGDLFQSLVQLPSGEKLQLRYRIQTVQEKDILMERMSIGMSCQFNGELNQPDMSRNENGFNYHSYLKQQDIHWILQAESYSLESCTVSRPSILFKIKNIRLEGIHYISSLLPEETRGYVAALVFGDRKLIPEHELSAYQQLGLIHLLAVSGLHISFLAGLVFYLGIRAGLVREHMKILLTLLLPVYALLTGASPSVWRACLMAMSYFVLSILKKEISLAASILAVYLFLLFIQPYMLYNIGFQLSFAVSFAMILSANIFSQFQSKLLLGLLVSTICQISALPILLFHFYEISFLGVFLNIIFVPVYSLLLPLSIMAILTPLIVPHLGEFLISLVHSILVICNKAALLCSGLPIGSIVFGKPSPFMMAALLFCLLLIFIKWDKTGNLLYTRNYVALLIILLISQYNVQKLSPAGEVTFIDIGQGDSILISLPFNKGNFLIDTGGLAVFGQEEWKKRKTSFNTGKDIIIPLLKSKGIHRLDMLILTHPDADHIGSVQQVLEGIPVERIYIGKDSESKYNAGFFYKAEKENINLGSLQQGSNWTVGDARFYVLNPSDEQEDSNESSVVIYAEIGGLTWLFTGDIGVFSENKILRQYPGLKADVLKVGHHGSKNSTSEEFLTSLQPKYAIISVGEENRYGHPHQSVLHSLSQAGAVILRTDSHGGISYRFKKNWGTFSTELP
ncbi:DNA internalization-related competence protein ComEC/Rec2 [Peribacillus sp. SCS-155]|uniref:DNA internalization-related competence protein ComEC/Rec2 n=1 Tax=Peribacillus sedimenti TaxID=3115297 RepID=UPI003905E48F